MADYVAKVYLPALSTPDHAVYGTFEGLTGEFLPRDYLALLEDAFPDPLRPAQSIIAASKAFYGLNPTATQPSYSVSDGKGNSFLSYLPVPQQIAAQPGVMVKQLGGSTPILGSTYWAPDQGGAAPAPVSSKAAWIVGIAALGGLGAALLARRRK